VASISREIGSSGSAGGVYAAASNNSKGQPHDLARPNGKMNGMWNNHHVEVENHFRTSEVLDGVGRIEGTSDGNAVHVHASVAPLSRSGRVSPATDMAVCCLDLSRQSLSQIHHSHSQDGCGLPGKEWEEGCHVYLHNHQHFHHIIQHSQP